MDKRISSKIRQRYSMRQHRQVQTKSLQQQTKKMEQQLNELKKQVQQQKRIKSQQGMDNTVSRWRKATNSTAPLKQYGKQIIQQQKQAFKKFGINTKKITGTKSFNPALTKLKSQKQQFEEKNMTKISKLMFQNSKSVSNVKQNDKAGFIPTQSIQNNFFKAKIQLKNIVHQKTLLQFLEQNFLQQYYKAFDSVQIKTLDDLRYVGRQRLQQLGVKPGHQIKIIKRVKQEFQTKIGNKVDVQKQRANEDKQVQLGYGDGNIEQYQQLNQQQNLNKKQAKQESLFLQKISKQEVQDQKSVENDNQQLIGQPPQQMSQYSDDQQHQQDYDTVEFPMIQICEGDCQVLQDQLINQSLGKLNQNSCLCFQCFKRSSQWLVSQDQRKFCSQKCLDQYISATHKKCPLCSKIFFKGIGFYQQGLWFCSIGCCPNRDQIEELFINWIAQQ